MKLNPDWVFPANPANTLLQRSLVLDAIANWPAPRAGNASKITSYDLVLVRRDSSAPHLLFHFDYTHEIVNCKTAMKVRFPWAFGLTVEGVNQALALFNVNPAAATNIPVMAETYIINKVGVRQDDIMAYPFFYN